MTSIDRSDGRRRRWRAAVAALAVVVVAVAVNVVAYQSHAEADLSADGRFRLSPDARALIASVRAPMQFTVFANATGGSSISVTPGTFNSGMAQWKFWAYDRSPRVEIVEDWFGFRAAGIRNTPKGNKHVRLYSFCLPYSAGMRTGEFRRAADPALTYRFIRDAVWNTVRWYEPTGRYRIDTIASRYLDLLLDGLRSA